MVYILTTFHKLRILVRYVCVFTACQRELLSTVSISNILLLFRFITSTVYRSQMLHILMLVNSRNTLYVYDGITSTTQRYFYLKQEYIKHSCSIRIKRSSRLGIVNEFYVFLQQLLHSASELPAENCRQINATITLKRDRLRKQITN